MATSAFRKALVYGLLVALAVGVLGSILGGLLVGVEGVVSALIAAGVGAMLTLVTVGSLLAGARLVRDDPGNPLYFAVILGAWLLKFVLFLVIVLVLRDQDFVHPIAIFACLVAVVVGGVIGDVVAVLRARVPYIEPRASDVDPDVP